MASIGRLAPWIDLIHRAIGASTAYTIARMKILERIPGNPVGVDTLKVGDATALAQLPQFVWVRIFLSDFLRLSRRGPRADRRGCGGY